MGFWWFVFVCDLVIPIAMLAGCWLLQKFPPAEINDLVGYKTARARKNIDTWRFAQEYCGRLWWKIGLIMLASSALIHWPFYNNEDAIGVLSLLLYLTQMVILLLSVWQVEKALQKTFDNEGKRKNN